VAGGNIGGTAALAAPSCTIGYGQLVADREHEPEALLLQPQRCFRMAGCSQQGEWAIQPFWPQLRRTIRPRVTSVADRKPRAGAQTSSRPSHWLPNAQCSQRRSLGPGFLPLSSSELFH